MGEVRGWKTLTDGRRVPMEPGEAEALWKAVEEQKADLIARMPDAQTALNTLTDAFHRLKDLGWREASYCPKDGSAFEVIEAGSSGIHRCHYSGEWPTGHWWVEADGDLWPSRPVLFRLYPEDQAKEDARWAAGRAALAQAEETR